MNFTIAGIALAVAAVLGGYGGYKTTRMHYEHIIDVADKKAAKDIEAANQKALNAASDYEVWASLQRPKTITVTREVEREVKADADCSSKSLPPSLRDSLVKAGSTANQPVTDGAVPAPPTTGTQNLWGRAARLFGGSDGAGRLQGSP